MASNKISFKTDVDKISYKTDVDTSTMLFRYNVFLTSFYKGYIVHNTAYTDVNITPIDG